MVRDARYVCPDPHCGGTLRSTGEKRRRYGGHHVSIFVCGECGREVERG
jgi:hypothetical protein